MNYQKEAVNKFKPLKVGALFMYMGTGKTKTILDIYNSKNTDLPIVYVCPASILDSTKIEVSKWANGIVIHWFSTESIGSSEIKYLQFCQKVKNSFLILDESIKFKNAWAKRTQRMLRACKDAQYRFILNGTPISRSILDLLTQMDVLSPKILNMNEREFAKKFLVYKDDNKPAPWRSWSKPCNEEALMAMIEPYCFYHGFEFNKNVSKKNIECYLNENERKGYDRLKMDNIKLIDMDFLRFAQKIQHYYTMCSDKKNILDSLLKEDIPTLYFVKYIDWEQYFEDKEAGIYMGSKKENFDKKNMMITYGCGAYGLNLQEYKRIVFVDSTFDYGQCIQAESRVIRIGQDSDVSIINLWVDTGLENIVRNSIGKKSGTSQNIRKILKNMKKEELLKL